MQTGDSESVHRYLSEWTPIQRMTELTHIHTYIPHPAHMCVMYYTYITMEA